MTPPDQQAPDDQTVLITRILEAPRERVFGAWSTPEGLAAWFGPAHAEVPADRVRVELRPGGRLELTMLLAGGREFPLGYDVLEVVEPELIVLRSDPMPGMEEPTIVRVELADHGGKTQLTLTDGPLPAAGRDGAAAGWAAALDQLAAAVG